MMLLLLRIKRLFNMYWRIDLFCTIVKIDDLKNIKYKLVQ